MHLTYDMTLTKPHFEFWYEKRDDYWKSPEGIRRRVDMLGQGFSYRVINGALQAFGNANNVAGWVGVEGFSEHCDYCIAHIINHFYRQGQFLPSLPAHFGCTCTWEIVWYEESIKLEWIIHKSYIAS